MFNYTHEIIINNCDRIIVGGAKFDAATSTWEAVENGVAPGCLSIKRGGNYDFKNLHNCTIHVTKGHAGQNAKAVVTVPAVSTDNPMVRLSVFVKTSAELVEYAMPNWYEFGKPILVEVKNVDGTAATLAASLCDALKLAEPYDNKFYKASVNGAALTIELLDNRMNFDDINIMAYDSLVDRFAPLETAPTIAYTANVEEFGTSKWIVENLRFPSYPNVRFNRLYADEAPIPGMIYDQYAFEYDVERTVPGGLNTVSEVCPSRTTHVIYILSSCAGDMSDGSDLGDGTFEDALIQLTANGVLEDDAPFASVSKVDSPRAHDGEKLIKFVAA